MLGIFLLGGWVAFEVVQTLTEGLGLPEWFPAFAIVLLIIGLPIVLATAFVQEGGPGRDAGDVELAGPPADAPSGGASSLFTWRNAILGGVAALTLLTGVGVGWILFGGGLSTGPAPTSIEQSVAVLPFVNMSGDPDNEYFSDGITEELMPYVEGGGGQPDLQPMEGDGSPGTTTFFLLNLQLGMGQLLGQSKKRNIQMPSFSFCYNNLRVSGRTRV